MAWYADAEKRPIAPGPNDPPIEVIGAILHVDAGDNESLYNYFSSGKSGGIESHFHVPKVGPVEQYRDTHYEADSNLKGNSFLYGGRLQGYVSIETQGLAKGEWNAHQLAQIKRLLKWLSETHNFPLQRCTSPTSPGVGYHVMWGAPSAWTPSTKVCPGPDRVRQFENELVPWFTENQQIPPSAGVGGDVATLDEVLAAQRAHEAGEAKRYADLRTLVQKLYDAEEGRYAEYKRRFDLLDAALNPGEPQ